MRSSVHRFEIELQDPYETARRSMRSRTPSRTVGWLLIAAALTVGCVLGWYASSSSKPPAHLVLASGNRATAGSMIEPGNPIEAKDSAWQSPLLDRRPEAFSPYDRPAGKAGEALSEKAWPIVLHRAGDGGFYADLLLDDSILTVRVDPARAASHMARRDLPVAATAASTEWLAIDSVLEHLRLPPQRFAIIDDQDAQSTIGGDILGRHFTIDEQADRLRLSPRRAE